MPKLRESQYLNQQAQLQNMQDAANDMLQASQDEYIDALQDKYDDFLKRVTNDAKALYSDIQSEYKIITPPSYSDYVKFQGDYKLAAQIKDQLSRLNQSVNTDLLDNLENIYRDSYNLNAWSLDEATPPSLDIQYRMPPDLVLKQLVSTSWTGNLFSQNIGAINDMMARDIQSAVAQAMLSGDSSRQLAKRIENIIGDGDSDYSYRAGMIARTELLRSANIARESVFNDNADVIEDWIWVTRALASGRLCEECAERAGHTKPQVEDIADDQDMDLGPPAHPFCACTWMPKVKAWWDLLPPGVQPIGAQFGHDSYTMSIPNNQQGFSKVTPMKYANWADRYLSESERGDI